MILKYDLSEITKQEQGTNKFFEDTGTIAPRAGYFEAKRRKLIAIPFFF